MNRAIKVTRFTITGMFDIVECDRKELLAAIEHTFSDNLLGNVQAEMFSYSEIYWRNY